MALTPLFPLRRFPQHPRHFAVSVELRQTKRIVTPPTILHPQVRSPLKQIST